MGTFTDKKQAGERERKRSKRRLHLAARSQDKHNLDTLLTQYTGAHGFPHLFERQSDLKSSFSWPEVTLVRSELNRCLDQG